MKRLFSLCALLLALAALLSGCAAYQGDGWEHTFTDVTQNPVATIIMEDGAKIVLTLYPASAPRTVCNFISLSNSGFYDGLTIHRISEGFVLQGGDPEGNGYGGPGYAIFGEFESNCFTENKIAHTEGTISMARLSSNYNSAGSQFFITLGDCRSSLDGKYAGFGKVTEGMDKLHAYEDLPREGETPAEPPVIQSIRVETFGYTYPAPPKQPAV